MAAGGGDGAGALSTALAPAGASDSVLEALPTNRVMSRLEARLALELAVEARYPRLINKKPIYGGVPIGARPSPRSLAHTPDPRRRARAALTAAQRRPPTHPPRPQTCTCCTRPSCAMAATGA